MTQPSDDGAYDHLISLHLPDIELPATTGENVNLAKLKGITVIYIYPLSGRSDMPLPSGWDNIPGVRGCTLETCGFRDHFLELSKFGATIYGLSVQSTEYQKEFQERLHLPFSLLSDEKFLFTNALQLPTPQVGSLRLLKRLTIISHLSRIIHVFYPVSSPEHHVEEVAFFLRRHKAA